MSWLTYLIGGVRSGNRAGAFTLGCPISFPLPVVLEGVLATAGIQSRHCVTLVKELLLAIHRFGDGQSYSYQSQRPSLIKQ
jgi:hypothetical protein